MATQNQTNNGPITAWVDPKEFVPTLHVGGTIRVNGQKPIVTLAEKTPQGFNPSILFLQMQPDVYDPQGEGELTVEEFQKPLADMGDYSDVSILTEKGTIDLKVLPAPPQKR